MMHNFPTEVKSNLYTQNIIISKDRKLEYKRLCRHNNATKGQVAIICMLTYGLNLGSQTLLLINPSILLWSLILHMRSLHFRAFTFIVPATQTALPLNLQNLIAYHPIVAPTLTVMLLSGLISLFISDKKITPSPIILYSSQYTHSLKIIFVCFISIQQPSTLS